MRVPDDGQGQRVLAPLTNVGDTIGVMELFLTEVTPQVPEQVVEAAHALACRRTAEGAQPGTDERAQCLQPESEAAVLPPAPPCLQRGRRPMPSFGFRPHPPARPGTRPSLPT